MTLARIQALRDLDYAQLVDVAIQRGLFTEEETRNFWRYDGHLQWTPDRLRLRIIDSICDEELAAKQQSEPQRRKTMRCAGQELAAPWERS